MTQNQKLINLLENELIPELEDYIDDLFELIAANKGGDETQEELTESRELHKEYQELLADAHSGDMDEAECAELIEELMSVYGEE
jgi:hypothetical protein